MPLSAMPGLIATQNPAASLSHPAPLATTGKVIFVSSTRPGRGDDNVGDDALRPKATWAAALRTLRDSAYTNRDDQIWLMPGHAETITTAAAIPMNVAGVSVFGMGRGASRPQITFATSIAASIAISAANCSIYNVVGIAGIAGLTQPFDVTANDCTLNIEWQDASTTVDAQRAVLATNVNRLDVTCIYRGFTTVSNVVNAVRLSGCNHVNVLLDAYGNNSVGWVDFVTTPSTNVFVKGKMYTYNVRNGSHNVVSSVTGSVWGAEIWDLGAGMLVSGGSGSALAPAYLNVGRLRAVLAAAGLLNIADDVSQTRIEVRQVRAGVSELVDYDLADVDTEDLETVGTSG